MAVPKRKISSHRQGRRRATHKVKLPEITQCQHCGADKLPYFLCLNCNKNSTSKTKRAKEKESNGQKKQGPKA